MITRASRLFFGLALVGYLLGLVYGIATEAAKVGALEDTLGGDGAVNAVLGPLTFGYKGGVGEHVGFVLLMGFAAVCFVLGIVTSAFRDGDPEALAEAMSLDAAPAVVAPLGANVWPTLMAVGAGVTAIGLATTAAVTVAGAALMVASGAEWAVTSWSEQATGDPSVNRAIRDRIMHPIEYPVAGVVVLGFIALGVSRLLLSSSETMAIIWALVLAAIIFGAALALNALDAAARRTLLGAAVAVGFVAVLGLGIYGAATGEREFETHGEEHGAVTINPSAESGEAG